MAGRKTGAARATTKAATKAATKATGKTSSTTPPKSEDTGLVSALTQALLGQQRSMQPAQLSVGIRNISSDTVGIPGGFGEPDLLLHPARDGIADPNCTAVISYPRWQALRRSALYDLGLIVRDDALLGEVHTVAPPDRPEELAPRHAINAVHDPKEMIEGSTEVELRERISRMTSEPSLRRLSAAVDDKIRELQGARSFSPKDPEAKAKIEYAHKHLPGVYRLVEQLVDDRLEELNPIDRV